MKKLLLIIPILMFAVFGCKDNAGSTNNTKTTGTQVDLAQLEKHLQRIASSESNGANATVKVEKILDVKEMPGFIYVNVITDKNGEKQERKAITNGRIFIDADQSVVLDLEEEVFLTSILNYENMKVKDIDVSNLTLAGGKKDGKNIIIEITDFECPYCKRANALFKQMLADKSDYALYIMHMPIPSLHPNAELMAKIFEAGMEMGYNFKNDLFEFDTKTMLENMAKEYVEKNKITEFKDSDIEKIVASLQEKILNTFASKTNDAQKFKDLVASKAIEEKVKNGQKQAQALGENSTPTFYFNGKVIQGFDAPLLKRLLENIN